MTDRRIDVFFYGLFMDADVLRQNGVTAEHPRRAYVDGYALRIGPRAALVPAPGARAFGIVFALTHDEVQTLYAAPGLEAYRPEAVVARDAQGGAWPALCYNLRDAPAEFDAEYAARLRAVLRKVGLPHDDPALTSG